MPFYTNTFEGQSGQAVVAEHMGNQFDAIESAFDQVEGVVAATSARAIRAPDSLALLTPASRPQRLCGFDSQGAPRLFPMPFNWEEPLFANGPLMPYMVAHENTKLSAVGPGTHVLNWTFAEHPTLATIAYSSLNLDVVTGDAEDDFDEINVKTGGLYLVVVHTLWKDADSNAGTIQIHLDRKPSGGAYAALLSSDSFSAWGTETTDSTQIPLQILGIVSLSAGDNLRVSMIQTGGTDVDQHSYVANSVYPNYWHMVRLFK